MLGQLEGAVAEEAPPSFPTKLSGVPLLVQAVLGTRKMSVREIAELGPGSIVQTDCPAGGAVELRVNSVSFGCGEVYLEDDGLRVQITELYAGD